MNATPSDNPNDPARQKQLKRAAARKRAAAVPLSFSAQWYENWDARIAEIMDARRPGRPLNNLPGKR